MTQTFDVAVIGAGVFGSWIAYQLRRSGATVVLLDAYGAGNSRASSGGESRIIRMGYGPDEIYTDSAKRSLAIWRHFFAEIGSPDLFQPTGVLWLAKEGDAYCESTLKTFDQLQVPFERLDRTEIVKRYPQLAGDMLAWGIFEPDSGVLMARQAVQAVVTRACTVGVSYITPALVTPPQTTNSARIKAVKVSAADARSASEIFADQFVFACGPWLPKLFPELLGDVIHVTRQEVFFLGVPAGDIRFGAGHLPAWIDFNDLVYGIPNLDNRGFKIAIDAHGPKFDPDSGDRFVTPDGLEAVRSYLSRRLPSLANAPVTETRVCQYENTSNGDFLIDRHPACENIWLVGGGSGHGFKHGPTIGEHVAALMSGNADVEPRFSLASKRKVQQRQVF